MILAVNGYVVEHENQLSVASSRWPVTQCDVSLNAEPHGGWHFSNSNRGHSTAALSPRLSCCRVLPVPPSPAASSPARRIAQPRLPPLQPLLNQSVCLQPAAACDRGIRYRAWRRGNLRRARCGGTTKCWS